METVERIGTRRAVRLVAGHGGADAHDGREHAIELETAARAGEELLDLVEHRVLIADKRQMILAGKLDESRVGC